VICTVEWGGLLHDSEGIFSQAFRLDQRINSKLEQVATLRQLVTKATSSIHAERVSRTRNRYPMENAIVKLIDLEHEINDDIDRLVDLKRDIVILINSVQQPEYHLLLELRYLSYKTWEEIAATMDYSYRQVHRLHGQALKEISILNLCAKNKRCHRMSYQKVIK
jgi:DNA-directed RNA polymerase specialized sigma subunit